MGDSATLSPLGLAAEELAIYNPGWDQVVWPWIVLPVVYRIACHVACRFIFKPGYTVLIRKSPAFYDWIARYVGYASGSTNPSRPYPLVFLGVLQLIFSLAAMAVFLFTTDLKKEDSSQHGSVYWIEVILGCFFFLHWFVLCMKDEFVVKDSILWASTLIDTLTVPQLILGARCGTLSLGFLRTYRALYTYERLEILNKMGIIHFWRSASDITRESLLTFLRFLSLIVLFAGSILILEVLGEPPFITEHLDHTSMGDISFFTLFYWVIETISTVGYGDYAPKTVPSRCVTMLCMVSGVLFFAIETTKFAEIYGLQMRGTGMYHKGRREHVVVLGSAVQQGDEGLLTAFFSELYHPEYKLKWPGAVILVSGDTSVARMNLFVATHIDWEARPLITVLQGSAVVGKDLRRCACDSAELVYILSDTLGRSGLSSQEEDKRNILRALAVRRTFPRIPLRLMCLRPDSRVQAVNAGIQSKRCLALNELKALLFWQSARVLGWSTFICNLIVTMGSAELLRLKEGPGGKLLKWREAYSAGIHHRIFGFIPIRSMRNASFQDFIKEAYDKTGMIVFAAQISGDVVLAPFHVLNSIDEDTVVFALAPHETDLKKLVDNSQDWRAVFYRNRFQKFAEDEKNSPRSRLKRAGAHLAAKKAQKQSGKSPTLRSQRPSFSMLHEPLLFEHQAEDARSSVRQRSSVRSSEDADNDSIHRGSSAIFEDDMFGNRRASISSPTAGMEVNLTKDTFKTLEENAERIREEANEFPFTTFIELSQTWEHAATFVRENRLKWLPSRTPLIILSSASPPPRLVIELGLMDDPHVGVIIGSPKQLMCLLSAGVQEATVVVCPAVDQIDLAALQDATDPEELAMVDADAIVVYQTLDAIGVTLRSMMLFEFKRIHNACLLPPRNQNIDWAAQAPQGTSSSSSQRTVGVDQDSATSKATPRSRKKAAEDSNLISQAILPSPSAMGPHDGQDDQKQGLCKRMWENFLSEGPKPNSFQATLCSHPRYISGRIFTSDCFGSLLARACYIPGVMEVIEALIVPQSRADEDVFVWQIHTKDEMVGQTFATCWKKLLEDQDGPALALGLYRFLEPAEELAEVDPPVGFVFTSPPPDTLMQELDLIYVLAPKDFGHRAQAEGFLYTGLNAA